MKRAKPNRYIPECPRGYVWHEGKNKFIPDSEDTQGVHILLEDSDCDEATENIWWVTPPPIIKIHRTGVLTSTETLLLMEIFGLSKKKGYCWASNKKLAKYMNKSEQTISLAISKMMKMGLILEHAPYDGRTRRIKACWTDAGHPVKGTLKKLRGDSQTIKGINNKYNNDTTYHARKRAKLVESNGRVTAHKRNDHYAKLGRLLYRTLSKHSRLSSYSTPESFANQLDQLKWYGRDNVTKALTWYCENIPKNDKLPKVTSAKHLLKKFETIKKCYERSSQEEAPVTISKETKRILKSLDSYYKWPKGSREQLPNAIQISLDNAKAFFKKIDKVKDKRLKAFVDWVRGSEARDIELFIQRWFERVNDNIKGWRDWSGNLTPYIFNLKSKQVQALGASWSEEYSGSRSRWDDLLKEIR